MCKVGIMRSPNFSWRGIYEWKGALDLAELSAAAPGHAGLEEW